MSLIVLFQENQKMLLYAFLFLSGIDCGYTLSLNNDLFSVDSINSLKNL